MNETQYAPQPGEDPWVVVERNDNLIKYFVKLWGEFRVIPSDDLMQEGRISMYKSIPHYDPLKAQFHTYMGRILYRAFRNLLLKYRRFGICYLTPGRHLERVNLPFDTISGRTPRSGIEWTPDAWGILFKRISREDQRLLQGVARHGVIGYARKRKRSLGTVKTWYQNAKKRVREYHPELEKLLTS